jgi:uncharacterized Fe-S cluster protein YjdI
MTTREYENDAIVVLWDAERCIHFGNCTRGLPGVFNSSAQPWIRLEGADAETVARVVAGCPSGALHFRRLDGGAQETPDVPTTVRPQLNGPLHVRGDLEVTAADGTLLRKDTRMALCRCGGSANKPFCDMSHRTNGFRAD